MQPALFDADGEDDDGHRPGHDTVPGPVQPAPPDPALQALATTLHARWPGRLHLGTSSWHFPGWAGLVWAPRTRPWPEPLLSQQGLRAYARHPLLNTVSLDRAFYRPLDAAACARLAAQVPPGFRFVVKCASAVSDAVQRDPASGAALQPNPLFLDPAAALALCVQPALQGLGEKLGVLVLQVSPLPPRWLHDEAGLHARLQVLFDAIVPVLQASPTASSRGPAPLLALELRDPALLSPALAALLKHHGVRAVLGLHDRMPAAEDQLPLLRATWPGDLVCRWNLQRGQRYAQARDAWAPFDRIQSPDPATRATLARVARATLDAGHRVFITINNKAEGSAPPSVWALARALAEGLDVVEDAPPAP